MADDQWITVAAEPLEQFSARLIEASGAPADIAALVARHLVDANLCGHDSHGVLRIPTYVDAIHRGQLVPDARPALVSERGVTAVLDGNRGYGYTAMDVAVRAAADRAKTSGVGAVAIRKCGHIGRVGGWVEQLAREGLVSQVVVGALGPGVGHAPPFGGAKRTLSTNPWALGVPSRQHSPIVVDFATTSVAEGKLKFARAKKAAVPEGWIVDANGKPTTNVEDFYAGGMLLPFGGHKGSGLSIFASMLGGLSGEGDDGKIGGTMIVALDPAAFGDVDRYMARVDAAIDAVKAVPPAAGFSQVLVPGEPESTSRAQRRANGIPLPAETWRQLGELADQTHVPAMKVVGV